RTRLSVIDRIVAGHEEEAILRGVPLTVATLQEGASFVLDATYEDGLVNLLFDGLKKVAGHSRLGDFHYIPMLFSGRPQVRKEQKLLLELQAEFLSRLQGVKPTSGAVWHGTQCKPTKVRLGPNADKAERVLQELLRVQRSETP